MKLLAFASAAVLCVALPTREVRTDPPHACARVAHGVDDPPPLDCPMCGGNVELHQKRSKMLNELRATIMLAVGLTY